jgi:alpha-L-rhamnosidase
VEADRKSSRVITRRQFLGQTVAAGVGAAVVFGGPLGRVSYAAGAGTGITVAGLKAEYAENLLGLDAAQPRLAWLLESGDRNQVQSAYQVLVASSEQDIRADRGDLWDSGEVNSSQSAGVVYDGGKLESRRRYYWKVRVWDKNDNVSLWSEPSWWEMGLLDPSDWQAQWIGTPSTGISAIGSGAPLVRKEFTVGKPVDRARVYVSGLGYYVLRLNGQKVGDRVLDPGYTEYVNRDGGGERVLYSVFDVTEQLLQGANAVGAELGNGYYNYYNRYGPNKNPKLILQLEIGYTDGTAEGILTDATWKVTRGPTTANNFKTGETYDARMEKPGWDDPGYIDLLSWDNAALVPSPGGMLVAEKMDPIKVNETLDPVAVTEPTSGVYVFDMGREIAGWCLLTVRGQTGTTITLQHGEKLLADGTVELRQKDQYICSGGIPPVGSEAEVWEARFTYKGFQYVQANGLPEPPNGNTLKGRFVHTAVRSVGEFNCSDELYNKIHEAMRNTILGSLQSLPVDSPGHEKAGWTGDAQLSAPSMMRNFDMASFFDQWLYSNRDMQLASGQLSRVAPNDDYAPAPEWTAAYPLLTWMLYWHYNDRKVLEIHYDANKRYAEWEIARRLPNGVSSSSLGDWLPPGYGNGATPGYPPESPQLTATAYVYKILRVMVDMAGALGHAEDASRYETIAEDVKASLNAAFLNPDKGYYETAPDPSYGYRQTSNAIPLAFGIVPQEYVQPVVESLVRDVEERGGHLNTGCLGTAVLLPVLTEYGYADVAHTVASQRTYPSWGFWIENGATTMWEAWGLDARSRGHAFFGTIDRWFYDYVAGIRASAPGFQQITIKPEALGDLSAASARMETVRGTVSSRWERDTDSFLLEVEIPVNATAEVHVPTDDIRKVTAEPLSDVRFIDFVDGYAVFAVGSGRYTFTVAGGPTAVTVRSFAARR